MKSGAKFCSGCGANLAELADEAKKPSVCPNCGAELAPDEKFCSQCGTAVGENENSSGSNLPDDSIDSEEETPRIWKVGRHKDCDFFSIQDAIDSASEGETVYVEPGVYNEPLAFTKSIKLIGCTESISDKSSDELPVVVLGRRTILTIDVPVHIEGFVFTHKSNLEFDILSSEPFASESSEPFKGNFGEDGFFSMILLQADVTLENSAFLHSRGHGITVAERSPELNNVYVAGSAGCGIEVTQWANPRVENCSVFGNNDNVIWVAGNASGTYDFCMIHDNKTIGLLYPGVVARDSAHPTFRYCKIYGHISYGIWVKDEASGCYEGCEVYKNVTSGIKIESFATPEISSCDIYENEGNGIIIQDNASGTYDGCFIHGNKKTGEGYPGVVVEGCSYPRFNNCRVYEHLSHGIWIKEKALGMYENCEVYENEGVGIKIVDSANPEISSCDIYENGENGIVIADSVSGTYDGCSIHGNGRTGKNFPGVVVKGQANPEFKKCEIYSHLSDGIWIKDQASGTYRNCNISYNDGKEICDDSSSNPKIIM